MPSPIRLVIATSALLLLAACQSSSYDPALLSLSGDAGVNALRSNAGLQALSRDEGLQRAAQFQADAMARTETMSHSAGGAFAPRVRRFYSGRGFYAENIAAGQRDVSAAVDAWIQSSPHRRNMLDRNMRSYGIASAQSASGRLYWAMVLGG